MSDVLSQNEINELLKSLMENKETEAVEESFKPSKKVRDYDFKTPKKLTKEQIKVIMSIHENFARQLSSYFSGILRTYCEIGIVSIEELHYYEYNNALPDAVLIGVVEVNPIEGLLLVDISNSITFNLIERLLGGGSRESSLMPNREFTEIETSLMERIFKYMTTFIKESWLGFMNVSTSLKQIETNARLIQSIPMDEIVIIIIMDVSIGTIKGTINFCIPCINLEALIDNMSQNKYQLRKSMDSALEEKAKEQIQTNIKDAGIELRAVFGETVLSVKDVLNLQVGDVIKFDQPLFDEVKINIKDSETWFNGIVGTKRNKKVVKISKVLQKKGVG